jgi:threonyl-tRNA synthetase
MVDIILGLPPLQIIKEKQQFERVEVSREEALSMFEENKFKAEIINGLPADTTISLYRCGPMVDLCHGPHLPNAGLLKASAVSAMNRAYWRADVNQEPLQVREERTPFVACLPLGRSLGAWVMKLN